MLLEMKEPTQALQQFEATLAKEPGRFHALYGAARARPAQRSDIVKTGLIDPYPARQAASIVALAAFNPGAPEGKSESVSETATLRWQGRKGG